MDRPLVWIGYDSAQPDAFVVAKRSLIANGVDLPMRLDLKYLRSSGLYTRPIERRAAGWFDPISDAPMSTEFAISRFLVPHLARHAAGRWALFVDSDVMLRAPIDELMQHADPAYAVMVVKHQHQASGAAKMWGQEQTSYPRKNWSSVCLWNIDHPEVQALTPERVNTMTGRDLHGFEWCDPDAIGALPSGWNHLVGIDPPDPNARLVHFTLGIPRLAGYENCEYAEEWRGWIFR